MKLKAPKRKAPENEFTVREQQLRAQGWLPRSERGANYNGPVLAAEGPCACHHCSHERMIISEEIETKSPPPARPNAPFTLLLQ
jgi:hypothetical protein